MLHTRVYLLRGVSGSGKSTFAEKFLRPLFHHFEVVSADRFFTNEKGEYSFDGSMLSAAHDQCYKNFEFHIQQMTQHAFHESYYHDQPRRSCLVVDNTNLEPYEMAPYMMKALSLGIEPEILTFNMLQDVNEHVLKNIHGIKEPTIQRQKEKFFASEIPVHWRDRHFRVRPTINEFRWKITREVKGEMCEVKNLVYPYNENEFPITYFNRSIPSL